MGRVGRRLGGALTTLGVLLTFWSRLPGIGVPLFLGGVALIVWAWRLD